MPLRLCPAFATIRTEGLRRVAARAEFAAALPLWALCRQFRDVLYAPSAHERSCSTACALGQTCEPLYDVDCSYWKTARIFVAHGLPLQLRWTFAIPMSLTFVTGIRT